MGADWKPDDSTIEGQAGIERITAALEKHHVTTRGRVVTSRDAGMDLVRHELMRTNMPPGVTSWQLPIWEEAGAMFPFITVAAPGTVVPDHSHDRSLFRIVISGSIRVHGIELTAGDWMYVPAGVNYSYAAGWPTGAMTLHSYMIPPKPIGP